jgi:integrase
MPAKIISPVELDRVLAYIDQASHQPARDRVMVLLGHRSGLRAQEVAGLTWSDVTDASGALAADVTVPPAIAKKGRPRTVPMHDALRAALTRLAVVSAQKPTNPIITGRDGKQMKPNAVCAYLARLYASAGLQGASSHSGRRSFLTQLARTANAHGCSIRDVQRIAGHAYLSTTEAYIELSASAADLVKSL